MLRPMKLRHLVLPLLAAPALLAQEDEPRLQVGAKLVPAEARPGSTVTLEVAADIDPGFHIYGAGDESYPSRLELSELSGLEPKGEARIPRGEPHESFGITNYWVEDKAVFRQDFRVPEGASGELVVKGALHYMACTPQFCDPPASAPFTATLAVTGGGTAAVPGALEDSFSIPGPQGTDDGPKITVTPRVEPDPARPGEAVELVVAVEVAPGWHVYGSAETFSIPTSLEVTHAGGLEKLGEPEVPPGEFHGGLTEGHWLSGTFEIRQWLSVPAAAKAGETPVKGAVHYMPCTESTCLSPAEEPFSVAVGIEEGPVRAAHVPPAIPAPGGGGSAADASAGGSAPQAGAALQLGLLALILASVGGGLFALAMPCTYPMIPITVSFFTKQAERRGGKVLGLALAYGAGIVLIFAAIGAVVAAGLFGMTNSAIIAFAGHWITNTVLAALFLFFALVLLGAMDLQPPKFLLNVTATASNRGGYLGVFLMGATLVIASFTCTAPIVGTLLGAMVQSDPAWSILGMAIFGLTMAVPFVVLSLTPARLSAMPRSGEWMYTLKVTLGLVEIAAVLKFLSNVDIALGWGAFPRELFLASWSLLFVITALFLLGLIRGRGTPLLGVGKGRVTTAIMFLLLAFYYMYGAMGYKLDPISTALAPNYSAQVVVARGGAADERHEIVKDDYDKALRTARQDGKLVLVNFTGFV